MKETVNELYFKFFCIFHSKIKHEKFITFFITFHKSNIILKIIR